MESNQYDGQYLLAEKALTETLNDINIRNEVRASRSLTLQKSPNEQQKNNQYIVKLGKLCSERKA